MNLYIINNVLRDYTAGMVVIAAPDIETCRRYFEDRFVHDWDDAAWDDGGAASIYEGSPDVIVIDSLSDLKAEVVAYVYGGG